jgi:hypothetical protein
MYLEWIRNSKSQLMTVNTHLETTSFQSVTWPQYYVTQCTFPVPAHIWLHTWENTTIDPFLYPSIPVQTEPCVTWQMDQYKCWQEVTVSHTPLLHKQSLRDSFIYLCNAWIHLYNLTKKTSLCLTEKHCNFITQHNQLTMLGQLIYISTKYGENLLFLNVKVDGAHSNNCVLNS